MAAKSALITGAAGFIGSHLTERCLQLGWQVTAVDSLTGYYDESLKRRNISAAIEHPSCVFIEQDLLDLELGPILEQSTHIFHLAAQPGVRSSWDDFELYTRLNVTATQRLLQAATTARVERVVIASSSSIYGDAESLPTPEATNPRPVSPYGLTKVAAEHLASVYWRSFGVPTVCLRYFTVFGPRQRPDMAFHRLISRTLAGEAFEVFGDGEQTRDFTFVSDAVAGTVAAAEHGRPGSVYNIGGGSRRSMNDVLDALGRIAGSAVERVYVQRQRGDARDTAADIALASEELGFVPSCNFESGLQAQLEWQRAESAVYSQG
jgi:UDP-glucose 4-epimerase